MIVVDSSVLCNALLKDNEEAELARGRISGEELAAPELVYLEFMAVTRRLHHLGELDDRTSQQAMEDLYSLPLRTALHYPLMRRVWELHHNITAYDASYIALAELLETTLVTADQRLANAPGPSCRFELLEVAA